MGITNRKFIILHNPISGNRKKSKTLRLVYQILDENGYVYYSGITNSKGNYDSIENLIIQEAYTDIIIVGGDGTINQVVNSLRHLNISFGIIPMGSGNGLAFAAKIPINVRKAMNIILSNRTMMIDAFTINKQFACMLTGCGFDGAVAHAFASSNTRGLITYVKHTFLQSLKKKSYRFIYEVDGVQKEVEAYLFIVANSDQFGNHVMVAPSAALDDGKIDVVIVPTLSTFTLIRALWRHLWRGRPHHISKNIRLDNNQIIYFQTNHFKFQNLDHAPQHIDGDPIESFGQIDIEVIPQCIRLLVAE